MFPWVRYDKAGDEPRDENVEGRHDEGNSERERDREITLVGNAATRGLIAIDLSDACVEMRRATLRF